MTSQKELVKQVKSKNRLSNLMIFFITVFNLLPQILLIYMIGRMISGTLSGHIILTGSGLMLLCFLLKALCTYESTWEAHEAAYNCLTELRMLIIRQLKKLPLGFLQKRKTGDLTNIVRNDVEQVELYLAHALPEIMSATLLPAVIFILMLFLDWRLALVMIVGLPLMWLTTKLAAPFWAEKFRILEESTTNMQDGLMEYVSNISVIKAFAKEETKTEKVIQTAGDYVTWARESMNGFSVSMGLINIFMESGVVLVMILGTWLLSVGQITVPVFILAMILGAAFTSSIAKTATFQHLSVQFNQAMEGIGSILNEPVQERPEGDGAALNGDIEIKDLSFSYEGKEETLEHISLLFRQGSKNALVGASGCGKSTLAGLMLGFWTPEHGSITVAGTDLAQLSEKQLSALFSIVQQETFLFNMSMEENIRIGKPEAAMEEIIAAAKKARIHEFIMGLPRQYATMAGEAGVKFSGGEKQRISIARMILKDAPIIILDEATAAVDAENEAFIQAAIEDLSHGKTVIMIAHHLNTIQNMDQIIVMDDGKIVAGGTHGELLAGSPLYQKMVADQNKVDNWNIKEG